MVYLYVYMPKNLFKTVCIVVCLIGIMCGIIYVISSKLTYTRTIELPEHLKASTSTADSIVSTDSTPLWGNIPHASSTPLYTGALPSDWKRYEKPEWEYQVAYPQNLSEQTTRSGVTLTFPRAAYFHWPLQDEARIVINATTTCPVLTDERGSTSTVMMNDTQFTRLESVDPGAGQVTRTLFYATATDAACYTFNLTIHGARGADLYVDDPQKIAEYDAVHMSDIVRVTRIFNTIVSNFSLIPSDPGVSEDSISPP
jgi:hypothetical protein